MTTEDRLDVPAICALVRRQLYMSEQRGSSS